VFALESENVKLRTKYVKLKSILQGIEEERQQRRLRKQSKKRETFHSVEIQNRTHRDSVPLNYADASPSYMQNPYSNLPEERKRQHSASSSS